MAGWPPERRHDGPVFFVQVARGNAWQTKAASTNSDNALVLADDYAEERVRVIDEDDLRHEGGERAVRRAWRELERGAERASRTPG